MNSDFNKGEVVMHLRELLSKLTREYNTEFNVVFLTPVGKIVCDLAPPAEEDSLIGVHDDPTKVTVDISAVYDGKGICDTKMINAKNVIVYKNNSDEEFMRAEQMILFTDQIIGFSILRKQI
jgi:hypothetical protein